MNWNELSRSLARERRSIWGTFAVVLFVVALYLSPGCAAFRRPKPIEPSVFRPAASKTVKGAVKEMTRLADLEKDKAKKPTVLFIGVLGDNADSISQATREALEDAPEIRTIDKDRMKAALKERGLKPSQVYLPEQRKQFTEALGESFDYLLAGYVEQTDEPIDPNDENSKTYAKTIYRLEVVDMETNKTSQFIADL